MRFLPGPFDSRQRQCTFRARWMACILTAALAQSLAPAACAQSDEHKIPRQPSESRKVDPISDKEANKYDVDHIGARGVGHGFNIYSIRREQALGRSLAASFDRNTRIITDPLVNDYVNRLTQKLVGNSDAAVPFTIKVIDSGDVPRAYGLPGGFLYIDSALILSADGEAELASVIAREIAHIAARHATRALTRKEMWNIVGSLAFVAGPAGVALENGGSIAGPLSLKKFLRDAEYEADLLGLEYLYAAGYDPQALLAALEKLRALEEQRNAAIAKIPGYHLATKIPFHGKIARSFASYPLTEERIQRLQSEIAAFLPNRKDYVLDTGEFQEVKANLLASRTPVLRHHTGEDDDNKGPVLRRNVEVSSEVRSLPDPAAASEITENSNSPRSDFPRDQPQVAAAGYVSMNPNR